MLCYWVITIPARSKIFKNEELKALLNEDCFQTQEELAESLGVT